MQRWLFLGVALVMMLVLAGCGPSPTPIVITATFPPPATEAPVPVATRIQPTPNPTRSLSQQAPAEYVVQAGDTLSGIASANNVPLDILVDLNQLTNPDALVVGQVLRLPAPPTETTPATKIISNGRFVRGPSTLNFDVAQFVSSQPGYIRLAQDDVERSLPNGRRIMEVMSAAEIVERVSQEFSVDPRLLLALLEYRGQWLTRADTSEESRRFPLGMLDPNREGLYKQLAWAADQLNRAYYDWRYADLQILQFASGERLFYDPSLNAGSVALQYVLSLNTPYPIWQQDRANASFLELYQRYFGDPFADDINLIPATLNQPELQLPFAQPETWFYTGGPHGGWGSGSAWAAVDLAPPDDRQVGDAACYISEYPVRAVADGVIARSGQGAIILDLNEDGFEETGWSILYLHVTSEVAQAGQAVVAGDVLGYASCEGGFSTATHLHIARRYNGEWIPTDCQLCPPGRSIPPFTLGGWTVYGIPNQEYQGTMVRGGVTMRAEQGRQVTINRISW